MNVLSPFTTLSPHCVPEKAVKGEPSCSDLMVSLPPATPVIAPPYFSSFPSGSSSSSSSATTYATAPTGLKIHMQGALTLCVPRLRASRDSAVPYDTIVGALMTFASSVFAQPEFRYVPVCVYVCVCVCVRAANV
jgi:hypothetical protein